MTAIILTISILFLIGANCITAFTKTLYSIGRIRVKKEFNQKPYFYFFHLLTKKFFPKNPWDNLLHLLGLTKHLLYLLYGTTFFFSLLKYMPSTAPIFMILTVTALGVFLDFLALSIIHLTPKFVLKLITPPIWLFFLLFSPLTFLILKIENCFFHKKKIQLSSTKRARIKDKILEFVHESELSSFLDPLDRKLITSLASFHDRIVREIMVPRVDIFALSINQTVHEAAQKFIDEGYSRIPIYQENIDKIVGVLLYKDVMSYYLKCYEGKDLSPLDTPLKNLIKPIIYAPETKKITLLLQEFRKRQIHLAIVVDEYGGTEGIVTIEDILEELVGEIADEHDVLEEEKFYTPTPSGGWIVDGKMSIIDLEKEINISIPQSPEYDTISGYVFHLAGTIPLKGWKTHHDNFDLEILKSTERLIEKVIITRPS